MPFPGPFPPPSGRLPFGPPPPLRGSRDASLPLWGRARLGVDLPLLPCPPPPAQHVKRADWNDRLGRQLGGEPQLLAGDKDARRPAPSDRLHPHRHSRTRRPIELVVLRAPEEVVELAAPMEGLRDREPGRQEATRGV